MHRRLVLSFAARLRHSAAVTAAAFVITLAPWLAGQQAPPRPLGPIVASAALTFKNISQIVALRDGRVLVNEPAARHVVLLDAKLANPTVIMDSIPGRDNSYGSGAGVLVRYRGDSLLFRTGTTVLVLDPQGKVGRVMTVPQSATGPEVALSMVYSPLFGIVYTYRPPALQTYPASLYTRPLAGQPDVVNIYEDSSIAVAMNLESRVIDTLARLSTGQRIIRTIRVVAGGAYTEFSVLPFIDDFAVMSDGSLAILRSREFRMEWINADRTRTSSARLPYDWRHVTDDDKSRMVDSINAVLNKRYDSERAQWVKDSALMFGAAGVRPAVGIGDGAPGGLRTAVPGPALPVLAKPSDLPDFYPPTSRGVRMLADADNHVWIPPATARADSSAALVYDVVDRKGAVIDRVSIPAGRTIVGFGAGTVFLTSHDAGVVKLEQARLR